jgi:hypothetical protein
MQISELESRWAELDRKLDSVAFDVQARVESMAATKSTTQRLVREVAIGVFVNAAMAGALGLFCFRHLGEWRFLLPALLIDACVITLLIRGIHQWMLLKTTNLGTAVIDAQGRIERLRQSRIQTNKWALALAPLLWTPLLIVALKAMFGVDSYAAFPSTWFVANVAFGLAFIVLTVWVSMRFGDFFHDASWVTRTLEDFSGRTRARSVAFMEEIRSFERER